jgi:hypothetical protein
MTVTFVIVAFGGFVTKRYTDTLARHYRKVARKATLDQTAITTEMEQMLKILPVFEEAFYTLYPEDANLTFSEWYKIHYRNLLKWAMAFRSHGLAGARNLPEIEGIFPNYSNPTENEELRTNVLKVMLDTVTDMVFNQIKPTDSEPDVNPPLTREGYAAESARAADRATSALPVVV